MNLKPFPLFIILMILPCTFILAQGSICAVGGGSEDINSWSDKPYSWIVEKADSEKIIILSYASATEWIPNYFKRFGAREAVNFTIDSRTTADEQTTYDAIVSAKGVFIKGGDQSRYVEYWKGTKTEDAIKHVFNNGGVIAGTSAGAMVLCEIMFTAEKSSIQPRNALINPFTSQITLDDEFLGLMPNVLFDTHFVERGRIGRLIPFMINYYNNSERKIIGVGIDDRTAICINENGIGNVYGSGAVSILRFDSDTQYLKVDDKYSLQNLKADKLLHDWSYDFNTNEIVRYSVNAVTADFNESVGLPANKIYITGDDNINTNFAAPFNTFREENVISKIAFIYDDNFSSTFEGLRSSIINAGIEFESIAVNSQNLASPDIVQSLESCGALVFMGSDLNNLSMLNDESLVVAQSVRNKIEAGVPLMFMGTVSKLLSKRISTNNEDDNLASYYGELSFVNGLGIFANAVLQPKVFKNSDFFENNVASIEYSMMLGRARYGFYIDQNELAKYTFDNGTLEFSGRYPIFIADAKGATIVDSSVYRASGSSGTRQVIGINNLRYTVSTLDTSFDLETGTIVSMNNVKQKEIPTGFIQANNYPNPFNPSTTIQLNIPALTESTDRIQNIKVVIYDVLGRKVETLLNENLKPGIHFINWDAGRFSSGVYYYKVLSGSSAFSNKMMFIK